MAHTISCGPLNGFLTIVFFIAQPILPYGCTLDAAFLVENYSSVDRRGEPFFNRGSGSNIKFYLVT